MRVPDISEIRVGLIPAAVGAITITGWLLTTYGWSKDTDAKVADLEQSVTEIVDTQKSERKENRKLRDAVNALIVELKVRGAVTEAETAADEAPQE